MGVLKRGAQIMYVPSHIDLKASPNLINSSQIEYGFIEKVVNDVAICRFWRHGAVGPENVTANDLRTKANGEQVFLWNLKEFVLVPPNEIQRVLAEIAQPTPTTEVK